MRLSEKLLNEYYLQDVDLFGMVQFHSVLFSFPLHIGNMSENTQ